MGLFLLQTHSFLLCETDANFVIHVPKIKISFLEPKLQYQVKIPWNPEKSVMNKKFNSEGKTTHEATKHF